MTYNIRCEGNEKIRLAAGQSYDLGSSEVTVADSTVAAVETQTVKKDKMSDYNSAVKGSLSTFKEEVNASAQLQDIEFIATTDGNAYILYNPNTKYYLLNSNATTYFTTSKATQNITKVDGEDSFEIQSPTNNGYVYFYNEKMGFDRVSSKDGYTDKGDFALELLEKQSAVSDSDPIPGYKRVSKITSGRKYLITQFITNGSETNIVLLYPQNGIANQTKLYRQVTEEEKTLKALKAGKTTATIDGKTYDIIVGSELAKPEVTLAAPTEGQAFTKAAVSNLSDKVTVKTTWKSGNKVLADDAKMEAHKVYKAIITLTATGADEVFKADALVSLNLGKAEDVTGTLSPDRKMLTITYVFREEDNRDIIAVADEELNITAAAEGGTPADVTATGTDYAVTTNWYEGNSITPMTKDAVFAEGKTYTVKATLTVKTESEVTKKFASSSKPSKIKVDGTATELPQGSVSIAEDGKSMTVSYIFKIPFNISENLEEIASEKLMDNAFASSGRTASDSGQDGPASWAFSADLNKIWSLDWDDKTNGKVPAYIGHRRTTRLFHFCGGSTRPARFPKSWSSCPEWP